MDVAPTNILTPSDRRRALLLGALVVAVVAVFDGLLLRSPERAAAWGAWIGFFLVSAELAVRVTPRGLRWLSGTVAVVSIAVLAALVYSTGGSLSPLFGALPLIPALGATIAPDDAENAPILAVAIPLAGIGVLVAEGRALSWIALWAAPVVLCGILVIRFSRHYRRQRHEEARAARERAEALDRLARAERELARVERLARLPLLADGVAHDLNSPLAVVSSSLAFVRAELRGGSPDLLEALADAAGAASAMRRIVGDLQRLARLELEHDDGASSSRATELALRDAVQVVATQLAEAATVRAEVADGLPLPVAPRHAVIDLVVQMVRSLATVGAGEIVVRAERTPAGLSLAAARRGAASDEAAGMLSDSHLSVCRAYVEGLGGTFRAAWSAGELRLGAVLPVLPD
jgi:signal transduction histidine kinase